jgi:hypothetical protein
VSTGAPFPGQDCVLDYSNVYVAVVCPQSPTQLWLTRLLHLLDCPNELLRFNQDQSTVLLDPECIVVAFGRRLEWVGVYMTRELKSSIPAPRMKGVNCPVGDPPCRYTPLPGDKGIVQLRQVGRSVLWPFSIFS